MALRECCDKKLWMQTRCNNFRKNVFNSNKKLTTFFLFQTKVITEFSQTKFTTFFGEISDFIWMDYISFLFLALSLSRINNLISLPLFKVLELTTILFPIQSRQQERLEKNAGFENDHKIREWSYSGHFAYPYRIHCYIYSIYSFKDAFSSWLCTFGLGVLIKSALKLTSNVFV